MPAFRKADISSQPPEDDGSLLRRRCAGLGRSAIASAPPSEPPALAWTVSLWPRRAIGAIAFRAQPFHGRRRLRSFCSGTRSALASGTLRAGMAGRARLPWRTWRGRLRQNAIGVQWRRQGRSTRGRRSVRPLPATTAAATSAELFSFRPWRGRGRRRWRGPGRSLLRTLRSLARVGMARRAGSRLRPARSSLAASVAITPAFLRRTRIRTGRTTSSSTTFAIGPPRLLLELLHLALHELTSPDVLPILQLIKSAVRTALPPLGIGLLAGGAENAFGQRHRFGRSR